MTDRAWQHPWLRVERLIRAILERRWNGDVWAVAEIALERALEERKNISRAGWMN